jgi:hypothetical protein
MASSEIWRCGRTIAHLRQSSAGLPDGVHWGRGGGGGAHASNNLCIQISICDIQLKDVGSTWIQFGVIWKVQVSAKPAYSFMYSAIVHRDVDPMRLCVLGLYQATMSPPPSYPPILPFLLLPYSECHCDSCKLSQSSYGKLKRRISVPLSLILCLPASIVLKPH